MLIKRLLLLVCLLFALSSGTCSAEEYIVTETQLQKLNDNLSKLEIINQKLRAELSQSKTDLIIVRTELVSLQKELLQSSNDLKQLQQMSMKQEESLKNLNQSFVTYSEQTKSEIRSLKLQRTLLGAAVAYLVIRK